MMLPALLHRPTCIDSPAVCAKSWAGIDVDPSAVCVPREDVFSDTAGGISRIAAQKPRHISDYVRAFT